MDKEKRVYVIECAEKGFDFKEKEMKGDYNSIMTEAEARGSVYSLEGFQNACNNEEVSLVNSFILIK